LAQDFFSCSTKKILSQDFFYLVQEFFSGNGDEQYSSCRKNFFLGPKFLAVKKNSAAIFFLFGIIIFFLQKEKNLVI